MELTQEEYEKIETIVELLRLDSTKLKVPPSAQWRKRRPE